MIILNGYQTNEKIYESSKSIIYKGLRKDNQLPVVMKQINREYPSPNEIARFKREFDITRNLDIKGIIKVYGLEKYQNGYVIIMEDFGGIDLSQVTPSQSMDLLTTLSIVIRITESLGEIHQQNIIHKDINPSNILWNPQKDVVKIIDFDIATALSLENPETKNPNVLEGTLPYISPEQTGRMNRSIDYRTDYYSLGITIYELITGKKPFESDDPMELVHCHIAKEPQPPERWVPDLPETVSHIIMKLMAKNAEDRYQSVYGLMSDLNRCYYDLQTSNLIKPFIIGQNDVPSQFCISQKLYGREPEIQLLMDAFERICKGLKEFVLVTGYSGIGKSSLVNEVQKVIVKSHGYFVSGKCNQYKRDIPYLPFIDAYSSLITEILTENQDHISKWKEAITSAIGHNGKLIIDVIPDLELIIGKQPNIPELPPAEAKNRFNLVFKKFIEVFACPEHPLIIFLDDLQWSDTATLDLMKLIMISPDIQHMMLIGAYRDNEVSASHPLMLAIDEMKHRNTIINTIHVTPLEEDHIKQLIADSLKCDISQAHSLGALCMQKTMGNPFFVNQLLLSLYKNNHIRYNKDQGVWQWDIDAIAAINITDNVVELMIDKIQQLPEATQTAIQLAACIGPHFHLDTLAMLSHTSVENAAQLLWSAVADGFIKADQNIWGISSLQNGDIHILDIENKPVFTFLHDRIQQAAYSLLDDSKKKESHLMIGRHFLKHAASDENDEMIFDVVNHLNWGRVLIQTLEERLQLAELNLLAGNKAQASAAYGPAYNYLKTGFELLGPNYWNDHPALALSFSTAIAEAAYLNSHFEESKHFADQAIENTHNLLDKIPVYKIKIQSEISRKNPLEAVKTGLHVLHLFNINFPLFPNKGQVLLGLIKVKWLLARKKAQDLIHIPDKNTPETAALQQIIKEIESASYLVSPNLLPLLIFKNIELSVKFGKSQYLCSAAATYGSILCGLLADIDNGYAFGTLAIDLVEKFQAKQEKPKSFFLVNNFIKHWKDHLQDTLKPLLDVYQSGLEIGDYEFAAYGAQNYCYHLFFTGKDLPKVHQELLRYGAAIEQLKQKTVVEWNLIYKQVVANLRGESDNPCLLTGKYFKINEKLPLLLKSNEQVALFEIHLQQLILNYIFEQYEDALKMAQSGQSYLEGVMGCYSVVIFHYYQSLTWIALLAKNSRFKKALIIKRIQKNQKKIKKWARLAPMNHQHRYDLVQAELFRISNKATEAGKFYTKAIDGAQTNGYLQDAALSSELAAKFYLEQDNTKISGVYLQDALYLYQRWGAAAKVEALKNSYARLKLKQAPSAFNLSDTQKKYSSVTTETTSEILDLTTVIKASQAISMELVLPRLFEMMLHIVVENAGAQKGVVILENQGDYIIEAVSKPERSDAVRFEKQSIHTSKEIPSSIVNYVVRTQTPLILYHAAQEGSFSKDAYIQKNAPKSILCMPIMSHGKLGGILYLENNVVANAFTNERIELLQILSSQMAISINNARLYGQLEDKNIDLQFANLQISHLLKATAEMSRATDKVMACIIAIKHLMALEKGFKETQIELFLPQKSGDSFTAYSIWKYNNIVENSQPYKIDQEKTRALKQLKEIGDHGTAFILPIRSKEHIQAVMEIKRISPHEDIQITQIDFIKGITRSLGLALENIDSVDSRRLAGIGSAAASIVHDLKNPIAAIIGYAEMAIDEAINHNERLEYLHIISKEASRMSLMAHEVLEFSRGELELRIDEIDVHVFGEDITRLLEANFYNSNITFSFESDYDGVLTLDSERIRRVILNLATNARDAMMGDNTDNGRFVLKLKQTDKGILFIAEDDGPGIPAHIHATLFEPFVTYGKTHGTGLGMAIVKKIVNAHKGTISFEAKKDKGTSFYIEIPMKLCKTKSSAPPISSQAKPNQLQKCVLVIDDDPNYRQLFVKYVTSWGGLCEEAGSGDMALDKLRQAQASGTPFDFVLIDSQMPIMDGETLGANIKRDPRIKDAQLIMITSNGLRGDAQKIAEIGFSGYFTKPVSKKQLHDCLDVLSQQKNTNPPLVTQYNLPEAKRKKIRLLLAEDNPVNQKLMARLLAKAGYDTYIVSNGEEAIKALKMIDYDAVLMDIQMPVVNGIEATRMIRNPDSGVINHDTLIIALTAHSGEEEIKKCHDCGMNAHLTKPINIDQLETIINKFSLFKKPATETKR